MLEKMSILYDNSKSKFREITGSIHSIEIMDYIFKNPLFTLPDLKKNSTITLKQQALTTLLGKLQKAGIIVKVVEKQGSKPAIWKFSELMNLIQG